MSISHAAYEAMVEHLADRDETIVRLNAELEDVRQQRETLKAEARTLRNYGVAQEEKVEALRAEVERRGEMLERTINHLSVAIGKYSDGCYMKKSCVKLIKEIAEMVKHDNAPDPSTDKG